MKERIVVVEGLDEREIPIREPVPPRQLGPVPSETVTYRAVFCDDCGRLCFVLPPGIRCVGCQGERDEAGRWAGLAPRRAA